MKFTNLTPFQAGWTVGFERDGRELLVVIIKGTYQLPQNGEEAQLADEQLPLVQADEFFGDPGLSAPRCETDYAHRKLGCDVLLVGSAYAPGGSPVRRLEAQLQVGAMMKRFAVFGDRTWRQTVGGISTSDPQPFTVMPINYERAFGGIDRTLEAREGKVDTFLANPAGCGYWLHADGIEGKPLPNTEEIGHPVTQPGGDFVPMALSSIGRTWEPRWRYAGTYDESWRENRAPFWPDDFDYRYFQAAPIDQIIEYPKGGEQVILHNLSVDGRRVFRLPGQPMSVTFIPYRGRDLTREGVLDTFVIEPDENRFTLTWRCGLALGKSVFDVRETIVGVMSPAWHRARRFPGKTYFHDLAEAVQARRRNGAT
jgi:hypothetical protein